MLRSALLAAALLACLLLAIAEFTDLNEIRIITVTEEGVGVGSHHGYALLIIALASAVMALGAYRGSRPAAFALAALGVAALIVVLAVDLPDVDATGLYGRDYEQAESQAAIGFYLETAGAILLLVAGVLTAVLGPSLQPKEQTDGR
ncbi:MAG: hypothetical protein WKF94_18540 [Solirubrobacteraceae bacterium]